MKVEPLPSLPFLVTNFFPALEESASSALASTDDQIPAPPVFRDITIVSEQLRSAVKPIKVPATLVSPHSAVARLLKQDAQRKPNPSTSSWMRDRLGPKFSTAIQQRRLRILSSILTEFERLGCKVSGSTHAGEKFSLLVGGVWAHIFFGVEGGRSGSYFYRDRGSISRAESERLRFDLVGHDDREPPKQTWREDKTALELQATDIVRGVLLRTELDSRDWSVQVYKWNCEDRERKIREAQVAAEKADADRVAREIAAVEARIQALVGGAEALERAAQIRRYVSAVRAAAAERALPTQTPEVMEQWTSWALAQADAIDPVASGSFVSDLKL